MLRPDSLETNRIRPQPRLAMAGAPSTETWVRPVSTTRAPVIRRATCRVHPNVEEGKSGERAERLEPLIFTVRGRRVILDSDLSRVYGVATKALNQAVKRNSDRFPEDFAFQLDAAEAGDLRSQIVTLTSQPAEQKGGFQDRSQTVTGSQKRRDPAIRPWVFTEHGALMAANILRSEQAARMSVYVIRAFVRLREELAANAAILKRLAKIDRTLLQHDAALREIYRKLLPLLQPPPEPPKRRIGFHNDD